VIDRKTFVAGALVASSTPLAAIAEETAAWRFAHYSDVHMRPDMGAPDGTRLAFTKIAGLGVDFSIASGDLVYDALDANDARATELYGLYRDSLGTLRSPVYNVVGNHDNAGVFATSGMSRSSPNFGKGLFERTFGKTYYSFNHRGWHFIVLDSVVLDGRDWSGLIDFVQLAWLKDDLGRVGRSTPVVVALHVPLMTSVITLLPPDFHLTGDSPKFRVANAGPVLDLLWQYNLKAVLQGHSHLPERVEYNGTQFVTSGAVSGAWWRGPFLNQPEGFGIIEVSGDGLDWKYVPSGFQARRAQAHVAAPTCDCLAAALLRAHQRRG